jgi:hypothetical protein
MLRAAKTHELELLGPVAEPALRLMLSAPPSLESRLRAEAILRKLDPLGSSREHSRRLRAVQVLEWMATPETRRLLRELA